MNCHRITHEAAKTYATKANAIKAVEKVYGPNHEHSGSADIRCTIVMTEDGRFLPLFIGESALKNQVHFNFSVAA